ncbi:MAG: hypothetical protein ISQ41_06075 [Flavobacteriaceae bacterium]|nr:hypothetical protein [Flavobacteriaceae bacterium]MBL6685015.1 hypothetical protein [Flavobacteriaceae bacterium]
MRFYFFKLFILISLFCTYNSVSQEKELFDLIITDENATPELLPERMIFTQRIFWGEKGILRTTGIAPLNLENREKELVIRRKMLKAHQIIGYTTLAAMVAQGIIGGQLYNGDYSLYKTHKNMAKVVNAGYFTGAALSLFSPPPLVNKKTKGFSSIKAHRFLSNIHFSAMVVTNMVADSNKKAHKAAAYTAFASYATAVIVFKF